ncbi:nuclear transport factor 2 family protein [Rhodoblastus sp. 17X3]|uniref:nuclear transport factor 2 family protein n=1 Tax=Rhodoblastus sp. 17X3 TaxID=3047026 RepID=UPI0024B683BC|nr:nuclear transport factor 2 family protein [Rhodoblastus sp. 17X3]MDI9849309.1 nuclear transport factor 2 family protein [Rhodoblastus sp. 17X3]
MQSDETLRKLGALDRELIERRVHALLEMRATGNLRGMLEYAAEDIVYNVRGNWAAFPYTRPVRGKKLVAEALTMISVQFENLGSDVHDLIIDGDRAAMRRTARIRHRGTGKVGTVDIADFVRFRDGLVVEFTEVADSMALAQLEDS